MNANVQVLWEDEERSFCREWRPDGSGASRSVLTLRLIAEHPTPASIGRLAHEHSLKEYLKSAWAVRPLQLIRDQNPPVLLLEDLGGEPLYALLGDPLEVREFLTLAAAIVTALGEFHQQGLVHKDIKPKHILVDRESGQVRFTGLGLASRLPRERQAPAPPEFIAGTLAYMAPEQTGRMNRSIDSRTDLYALGVTFYQMLTGSLPFRASDPMEWIHCHIARTPPSPNERLKNIPKPISQIVMKLLAKMAEERYQTAAGLEHDLRRCLTEWEARGFIGEFPLGEQDLPDQFLIPEKLYGRDREVNALLAAFDRTVAGLRPELVLVSGYSGIGKSSVVNELHKVLVPPRGLFAAGKFDQYKRDVPYATLAEAFQSLVRQILSKSEAELHRWRGAFHEALGPNGRLMVDFVPELELVIGPQPPVPELSPKDAQRRFQLVFRRFTRVFASPEHPLALFLDDLQWLDAATLDLLDDIVADPDIRYLLLIGAFRDNEVTPEHPLMRRLELIRQTGVMVTDIVLAPLEFADLTQLIADSMRCEPIRASSLARLVQEKTGGNPFFAIQFLHTLADEGLLTFNYSDARWSWDLVRIHDKRYTDNVVDLMVVKLNRLPVETQGVLQQLACVGHSADADLLATVSQASLEELHGRIWEAVRSGLVLRSENSYSFYHDRVQEAAYSRIPEPQRADAHLRIGRLLSKYTSRENHDEIIFDIVNQFNRSEALITSWDERDQVAEFNRIAGERAKSSAAYVSATKYFIAGADLLTADRWKRQHALAFRIELQLAECEFLTGDLATADQRLCALANKASDVVERASVACLHMDVYTALNRSDRAVEIGLEYVRHLGLEWPPHPTDEEVRREYDWMWSRIGDRTIEELIELPLMTDPASLASLDVLTKILPPALFTDPNLFSVAACRAVTLSLERGNSDASCVAYVWLGMIAGPRFDNYKAGFRFGRLGYELVETRGLKRFAARSILWFAQFVVPWARHVLDCRDLMRRAFDEANKAGDLTIAGYCCNNLNTNFLAAGDSLIEAQREAEHGIEFARKTRFDFVVDIINGQLGLIRTLRGLTPKFGSFDDDSFNETQFEEHLASEPSLALPECWYWTRKIQANFFAGDYPAAITASVNAEKLLWTSPSIFEKAEVYFYGALARTLFCTSTTLELRLQCVDELAFFNKQLKVWAVNCPENFETRAALVDAEIARLEGRELDAERMYDRSIRSAHANGFIHNEALASELASRFYAARGLNDVAEMYLLKARNGYRRWGADAKVRQLEEMYPQLRAEIPRSDLTGTIGTPVENLDLATVISVSQAISSEIVLDNLLETIMRTAIHQAGAQRGLLISPQEDRPCIEAEAITDGDVVAVHLRNSEVTDADVPISVIRYATRTGTPLILDHAANQHPFADDPYIKQRRARSILCLPLLTQGKLSGVLYLENNLVAHVFMPGRTAVLKLLATQAAIALENARLYRDAAKREAKIRRLVESNIIGILIWEIDGQVIDANDAFLRMVGYHREDLAAGRLHRTDLSPADWRERDARTIEELKKTGTVQPFEKEYLRKDGSRVPVLIGMAAFDEQRDQGVAFVLDLTERKRAEEAFRELESNVAHMNRLSIMGELTASLAHEITQPIATSRNNARAALNFLDRQPPKLHEVREALAGIVDDADRAGQIIDRIRDHIKKAPPRKACFDLNQAIEEVIVLGRSAIAKNGVLVETRLTGSLLAVLGDCVQLQQVILNLVLNAVEAMSSVGVGPRQLLISTEPTKENGVIVAVRDSGPGIAPLDRERIFQAFYTTKTGGVGMGLAICRSIIDAHGGRLWADANEPQGAVFQFTLPGAEIEFTNGVPGMLTRR